MPAASRPADPARALLDWYDIHGRDLPWRVKQKPGRKQAVADPYRVWLSEIMLQQTAVATAIPYYRKFLGRWPTLDGLAAAALDDVLAAWAGLGYYARARNLHACARVVVAEHGGKFPADRAALRELPGIGPYTSAAIAAIAFGRPETVVDGNVERVMARLYGVTGELPGARPALRAAAEGLTPAERPGDYAQAVMDLGATLCSPRAPDCGACPWAGLCLAGARGIAESLPRRAPRAARPVRRGLVFWTVNGDREVLLRKRPERGLLGGMMEVPTTPWREAPWTWPKARAHAPCPARWRRLEGTVRHTFSHFELELEVRAGRYAGGPDAVDGRWVRPEQLGAEALPSVMRKVVKLAGAN